MTALDSVLEIALVIAVMAAVYAMPLQLEFSMPYSRAAGMAFLGIGAVFGAVVTISSLLRSTPR